ncbi:VOC family protein [Streptomyces sp. MJM1172]|uniref:VOC family protein n=1 Tax=Streptomyces sp. MJM1172 TaxID=1703926 RepID=UPI00093A22CB|nr:VOC family protein [Streptomyces sp. MJM1172]OKI61740.1 extradiol dioxygenase [Streptomyces sp. MJM1172]
MTVPKTSFLVLDCAEPEALARFYAEFLDASAGRSSADPDLFLVTGATGVLVGIRRDPGQAPPSWPRPEDSQQAHLHVLVAPDRLDQAEREAVALGARPVGAGQDGTRLDDRTDVRRLTDPAGHAFLLVSAAEGPGIRPV